MEIGFNSQLREKITGDLVKIIGSLPLVTSLVIYPKRKANILTDLAKLLVTWWKVGNLFYFETDIFL